MADTQPRESEEGEIEEDMGSFLRGKPRVRKRTTVGVASLTGKMLGEEKLNRLKNGPRRHINPKTSLRALLIKGKSRSGRPRSNRHIEKTRKNSRMSVLCSRWDADLRRGDPYGPQRRRIYGDGRPGLCPAFS